jgi:hypothetical protein
MAYNLVMDAKKKNVTLDDLATAMQAGFKQASDNHESLARMVAEGFESQNERFDKLETEIQGLRSSVNNHLELSDKRYLELKARQNVIVNWVKTIGDKTGVKINLEDLEKAA